MKNKKIINIVLIIIMIISLLSIITTCYITVNSNNNLIIKNNNSSILRDEKPPAPSEDKNFEPEENNNKTPSKKEENKILKSEFYIVLTVETLIFSTCITYLIISKLNEYSIKESFSNPYKIMLFFCIILISTSLITIITSNITIRLKSINTNKNNIIIEDKTKERDTKIDNIKPNNNEINLAGANTINDDKILTGTYTSENNDENTILVNNGGNLSITDSIITKSGDATNIENSDFYGINSAILVQKDSIATIKNSKITTSAKGSNAIFATGEKAKISINNSTIETIGSNSSRGLDATYGGLIEADSITITTMGESSATLATDRGEGTIKVTNSNLTTNGKGSPIIYSTGDISIDNTTGVANSSQMVVIEGKNSASVNDSILIASGTGNRNNVDKAGVMIYQSMSGDSIEGLGVFNSTNTSLTITEKSEVYKTAPMFFVTNTDAEINLTNTKLKYGSNILLSVVGTDEWGIKGENGGNVTMNTNNQTMSGRIIVDNISTLNINLVKTSYRGTINTSNVAKEVNLKIDKDSIITLTADTYVTSLENEDKTNSNIEFNDYKLYVNGTAISKK